MDIHVSFSPPAEEDLLDSKAHTYPRRRSHTIGSSNVDYSDGMNVKHIVIIKLSWSRNQHPLQLCHSPSIKSSYWLFVDRATIAKVNMLFLIMVRYCTCECSMAEWLACKTCNPVVLGLSPALTTTWSGFHSSPKFKSLAVLVNSHLVCLWPFGILKNTMFKFNYFC